MKGARTANADGPVVPVSLIVALLLFMVFALVVPRFFTFGNLENVARIGAILSIAASGQAIVLILGCIEFSFGSTAALASVAVVMVLPELGPIGAFTCGALVAVAVGALNGALVGYLRLSPVIVTLGTLMAGHGLAASLAGGLPIDAPASTVFSWPGWGRVFGLSVPVWLAIGCFFVLYGVLRKSRLGRQLYLVGANPAAARISGIELSGTIFRGYMVAAAFMAVAAIILTSRVASGQPNLSPNLPFETIAACAIGGIPLAGGRGRVIEVIAGVATIAMLDNAVVLLNYPAAIQQLLIGAVILGAVLLPRFNWRPRKLAVLGAEGERG